MDKQVFAAIKFGKFLKTKKLRKIPIPNSIIKQLGPDIIRGQFL